VPALEVYRRAFRGGDVGSAAAVAVTLAAMIFALAFAINRVAERSAR
jgi:raffinose/stachyose/melibiose transport system permease protein